MKKLVLIAVMSVTLGACSSSSDSDMSQRQWSRKGKTTKQASQQVKHCEKQVKLQPIAEKKRPSMFRKCMSDKGYRYGVVR